MKNVIDKYRIHSKLTYRQLARKCGVTLNMMYRHCHGKNNRIPAEMAVVYSRELGIPLCQMRPDLWPAETQQ